MKNSLNVETELAQKLQSELSDLKMVFRTVMEASMAGWWDWRIKDNTEYLSPTLKSMFGYEDHEMDNSPESWQKIIHPDDLPGVFDLFNQHVASKGKIPFDNTVRYFHKSGSIVWVFCRGHVVEWDDNDQPIRMVGTHVDITKLKQTEEELKINVMELENINDLMIERELKMIDLKNEIESLKSNMAIQ